MAETFEVLEFIRAGRSPFAEWFNALDSVAAARVDRYGDGWKPETLARPNHCAKVYMSCAWTSVLATGCIMGERGNRPLSCSVAEISVIRPLTSRTLWPDGNNTNRTKQFNG